MVVEIIIPTDHTMSVTNPSKKVSIAYINRLMHDKIIKIFRVIALIIYPVLG